MSVKCSYSYVKFVSIIIRWRQNHISGGVICSPPDMVAKFIWLTRPHTIIKQFYNHLREKNGVLSFIIIVLHCWTLCIIFPLSKLNPVSCTCSLSPFLAVLASVENTGLPPLSITHCIAWRRLYLFTGCLLFLFWNTCSFCNLFS